MRYPFTFTFLLFGAFALLLSSCSSTNDSAKRAVEDYLNALVIKDVSRLSTLSCAEWEPNALLEYDSLQAVKTRLEGLMCQTNGVDGDYTLVSCQGAIIATYNDEDQAFDLSLRTYQVVQQGGEYLVCGYR